jgi:hypothetical protein
MWISFLTRPATPPQVSARILHGTPHGETQNSGAKKHPQNCESSSAEANHRTPAEEDPHRARQAGGEGREAEKAQDALVGSKAI